MPKGGPAIMRGTIARVLRTFQGPINIPEWCLCNSQQNNALNKTFSLREDSLPPHLHAQY